MGGFQNICTTWGRRLSSKLSKSNMSVSLIEKRFCKFQPLITSSQSRPRSGSNSMQHALKRSPNGNGAGGGLGWQAQSQSLLSHSDSRWNIDFDSPRFFSTIEDMTPEEKAAKFNRPKAQTTIDEEEVSKFSGLSALWWDEGGEFEALHSLNELRVPLIRDALVASKRLDEYSVSKPLEGYWILDVGSGGGILSEPLARLGANVIGLEASEENIKIAQAHLMHDREIRDNIKYINATVEDIAESQEGKFDAVVASEVLEHVADADTFVAASCKLVRPGGSIFFTTLNKTQLSYYLGIVAAERILKLVSPGTHDWNKFVTPMDLEYMLEKNNFSTRLVHGMWYSPLSKRWSWTKDTSINYAIHGVRAPASEGEVNNPWTDSQETSGDTNGGANQR